MRPISVGRIVLACRRSLFVRYMACLTSLVLVLGVLLAGLLLLREQHYHVWLTHPANLALFIASIGFAFLLLSAGAFSLVVSGPIHRLLQAIDDRAAGREWKPADQSFGHELGDVIEAFDMLMHHDKEREHLLRKARTELRTQQEELSYLNGTLEQIVLKRTRQLELAKKEAEAANASKSRFLWSMSHELRTPLNAIIGFSEMIEQGACGPVGNARYTEYAGDIGASGRHLLSIINTILTFAKIEAGAESLQESEIEVDTFLDDCMRMIAPLAERSDVKVARVDQNTGVALLADETKVRQIVLNVMSNAVKFNRAGGEVILSAQIRLKGELDIEVRDTGIGMRLEDIPLALKEFGQLDNSLGRRYEGTGLGLPIANKLAMMHGGAISVASTLGAGTTVTIRFPAERVTAPDEAERSVG